MALEERRVLEVAAAVADGLPVDWDAALASAGSREMSSVLSSLREISALSSLTRTLDSAPDASTPQATLAALPADARALPHWSHFVLLELLGRGAQGEVFRAVDTRLEREVALKVKHSSGREQLDESTLREARLLARLRHPNIVTVYGADVADGRVGIWMELVKGDTLEEMIRRAGPMSAAETALVGVSLCRALATVHAAGLLHGDVKAQNVMREAGGRYVLMDFGVGRDTLEPRHSGAGGTPLYLAPEVLAGGAASIRSDVYAMGVLLYFLATGSYPVSAKTVAELRIQHERSAGRRLTVARPDLPRGFVEAIEGALCADPTLRLPDASTLADALGSTLSPAVPVAGVRSRRLTAGTWAAASAAAIAALSVGWWAVTSPGRRGETLPTATIAVLPFDDLSADRSIGHVAQGLTEVLTTALGTRTRLQVIGRTTAQAFVGPRRSLDLARDAGVDMFVEGSVTQQRSALATSVRLVDARTNRAVWAASFAGDLTATGALAETLLAAVSGRLDAPLSPRTAHSAWPADTATMEAYFRGWGEYWHLSREGFVEAIRLFKVVREKAPDFAEAHAAYAYARLTHELSNREPGYEQAVRDVSDSANEALRLDPDNALATATSGWLAFYADWDWPRAEALLARAVELNPSDPQVRWMYAQLLMARNRLDAALEEARLARRLDPLNPVRNANVGSVLYYARRYDDAIVEMQRVLAVDPNAAHARFSIARMFSGRGQDVEAVTWLTGASHLGEPYVQAELARLLIRAGRLEEANQVATTLERDYRNGRLAPDYLAFVRLAQGNADAAMALLQEAVADRSGTVIWIYVDPRFDALRDDPRFGAILKQLKLTPTY